MRITWFGHSAFRIEIGNSTVMIDPFLSGNPTWDGSVEDAAAGATHVVLTHGHDDHIGDTVDICKEMGALLVANFEICMYLSGKGVSNFSPTNHGGQLDFGEFAVAFVPAWHSSSTMIDGKPVYLGNPAGIVLTPKDGKPLYHMGDTDIFPGMALVEEIYRPRIGIVPVGDRFTMGARTAALACRKYFSFDAVIPCHSGTFPLLDADASRFVAEMGEAKVVVPERGTAVDL